MRKKRARNVENGVRNEEIGVGDVCCVFFSLDSNGF